MNRLSRRETVQRIERADIVSLSSNPEISANRTVLTSRYLGIESEMRRIRETTR
jgi:hypothetical protein